MTGHAPSRAAGLVASRRRTGPRQTRPVVALALGTFLVVVLAGCGAGRGRQPAERPRGSTGPATFTATLQVDGRDRTYRVHLPPAYDGRTPLALLLAFHGGWGTGVAMASLTGLDQVSDANRFIAVYPDGIGRSWNAMNGMGTAERRGVDDVSFVRALIDRLEADFLIAPGRIYATGMSIGAMFVHLLGCQLSGTLAGIAAVAGSMPPQVTSQCRPAQPISVLQIHGTADPRSPYEGGHTASGGAVEPVTTTVREWAHRDGCVGEPEAGALGNGVVQQTYRSCRQGAEVAFIRVDGGGHTWPGGLQYLPRQVIGETNRSFDASQTIWRFLSARGS